MNTDNQPKKYSLDDPCIVSTRLNYQAYEKVRNIKTQISLIERAMKDDIFTEIEKAFVAVGKIADEWLERWEEEKGKLTDKQEEN